jgi:hypothetical protein
MRSLFVLFIVVCTGNCLAQTDSMFVERTDGTIRAYPISLITKITFLGTPTSIHEQELVQNALSSFALYQNYPNPFNPSTTIQYQLPHSGDVEVNIYDIQGRLVRSLFNSNQQVGTHAIVWDSQGSGGRIVASGTYFCQILFNGSSLVRKLVLIK